MKKIKELYKKYKEIINYIIMGGLTTVVNFIVYFISTKLFSIDEVVSNVIAWVLSVLFAYVSNKLWVFETKTENVKDLIKELSSFVLGRIATLLLCDIGMFIVMIRVLYINEFITKLIIQVIIVVLNYIISKLLVFRKKKKEN